MFFTIKIVPSGCSNTKSDPMKKKEQGNENPKTPLPLATR